MKAITYDEMKEFFATLAADPDRRMVTWDCGGAVKALVETSFLRKVMADAVHRDMTYAELISGVYMIAFQAGREYQVREREVELLTFLEKQS